jgi:hypothetical protein
MKQRNLFIILMLPLVLCCKEESTFDRLDRSIRDTWQTYVERFPVPKDAHELHQIGTIPGPELIRKGIILNAPSNMLQVKDNLIYITDRLDRRVLIFNNDGGFLHCFGEYGQGPGEFEAPIYIGQGLKGNIVIFDGKRLNIQTFDSTGNYIGGFRLFKPCYSMGVDKNGNIYLNFFEKSNEAPLIAIYNPTGYEIGKIGKRIEANSPSINDIDIFIAGDGIYAAWKTYPLVRKYSFSGEVIFEHYLDYGPMKELGQINREAVIRNGGVRIFPVLNKISAKEDSYYILRCYPRLEVLNISLSGIIKEVCWEDTPYDYLADDIIINKEGHRDRFFILEKSPEARISIFCN